MFGSLVYRHSPTAGKPVDIGQIFELSLFYRKINLYIAAGAIPSLIQEFEPNILKSLIEDGHISVTLLPDHEGVYSNNHAHGSHHCFTKFRYAGRDRKIIKRTNHVVGHWIDQAISKNNLSKREVYEAVDNCIIKDENKEISLLNEHSKIVDKMKCDPQFVRSCFFSYFKSHGVEVDQNKFIYDIIEMQDGIMFTSNFEFEKIKKLEGKHTAASFLAHLQSVYSSSTYASYYVSEISCEENVSLSLTKNIDNIIQKMNRSDRNIQSFIEKTTQNLPSFSSSINEGLISQSDALRILRKSQKFKEWVGSKNGDVELIGEYYKDSVHEFPSRKHSALRFITFASGGVAIDLVLPTGLGTAAGVAAAAIDQFLVGRLNDNWKPNIFIENALVPALKKTEDEV